MKAYCECIFGLGGSMLDPAEEVERFLPVIETARRAEAAAIEAECPLHNKKHNRHRMRRTGGQWHPVADAA